MPWAAYAIGGLAIILCIPGVREMVGVIILTFGSVPIAIAMSLVRVPLTSAGFTPWQVNLAAVGLIVLVWVGIAAVAARSFIRKEDAKQDASGALNALILVVGLPICWLMSFGLLQGLRGL